MKNKRTSPNFLCSLPNTPENHAKVKNLSMALRKLGVKFRMFRYGRGTNRKAIWQKQVEHSVKTGKGWEGDYQQRCPNNNITNSNQWRPRLQFCERFDVYLEITEAEKIRRQQMLDLYNRMK